MEKLQLFKLSLRCISSERVSPPMPEGDSACLADEPAAVGTRGLTQMGEFAQLNFSPAIPQI